MTEKTVAISMTINIGQREIKAEQKVKAEEIEEAAQEIGIELGQEILRDGIRELDRQMSEEVPKGWRNVGTESRWVISSVGEIHYTRRIYQDGQKRRRKPVDELLGLEKKGRMSRRVREMGSYLASES
jgi:hypothetical protein